MNDKSVLHFKNAELSQLARKLAREQNISISAAVLASLKQAANDVQPVEHKLSGEPPPEAVKPVRKAPQRKAGTRDREIGQRLRTLRVATGQSMETLGQLSGTTHQMIHRIETGRSRIFAGQLEAMAEALQVPIEAFYQQPNTFDDVVTLTGSEETTRILKAVQNIRSPAVRSRLVALVLAVAGQLGGFMRDADDERAVTDLMQTALTPAKRQE